jgi:BirA family biotin operon repressor/biotin-[acetyl-CoA-carboxylase] ligase
MYFLRKIDSTNRLAKNLAEQGECAGTVVIADFQTAGRGRRERRWVSPAGDNLLFSLILRPDASPLALLPLSLAISLAIADGLGELLDTDVQVKWPNDVVTSQGKICGILSESSTGAGRMAYVIVGIGINVNMTPEQFPDGAPAASCLSLGGTVYERADVLADTLNRLEPVYGEFMSSGFAPLVERYKSRLSLMHRTVRFERDKRFSLGEVSDVQHDGGLVIRTGDGSVTLYGEDVTLE